MNRHEQSRSFSPEYPIEQSRRRRLAELSLAEIDERKNPEIYGYIPTTSRKLSELVLTGKLPSLYSINTMEGRIGRFVLDLTRRALKKSGIKATWRYNPTQEAREDARCFAQDEYFLSSLGLGPYICGKDEAQRVEELLRIDPYKYPLEFKAAEDHLSAMRKRFGLTETVSREKLLQAIFNAKKYPKGFVVGLKASILQDSEVRQLTGPSNESPFPEIQFFEYSNPGPFAGLDIRHFAAIRGLGEGEERYLKALRREFKVE